jgi:plastocyanin
MKRLIVMLLVLLIAATACSDDDDDGDEAEPAATTATTGDVTTSSSPADDATCAPVEGPEVAVTAKDFSFSPRCIHVRVDQELKVTNSGSVTHNVTVKPSTYDQDIEPTFAFETGEVGGSLQPGTYELACSFHEGRGMKAELRVVAA